MLRFIGEIEVKNELTELSKKSRLQRMKEVREQEKKFAIEKSSDYRKYIDERKQIKYEKKLQAKKQELLKQKLEEKKKLQYYLVQTGEAHRLAKEVIGSQKETIEKKIMKEYYYNEKAVERSTDAFKIIREKKVTEHQKYLEEQQMKYLRDQYRQETREDAHLYGESRKARKERDESPVSRYPYHRSLIARSAERVHERFPSEVRPVIVRHFPEDTVRNNAENQEKATLRKSWKQIMDELKRRKTIKFREKEALFKQRQVKGAKFLEEELQFLYSVDKSRARIKESTEVHLFDEENIDIRDDFEKIFMSAIAIKKKTNPEDLIPQPYQRNQIENLQYFQQQGDQYDRFSTSSSASSPGTDDSLEAFEFAPDVSIPKKRTPGKSPAQQRQEQEFEAFYPEESQTDRSTDSVNYYSGHQQQQEFEEREEEEEEDSSLWHTNHFERSQRSKDDYLYSPDLGNPQPKHLQQTNLSLNSTLPADSPSPQKGIRKLNSFNNFTSNQVRFDASSMNASYLLQQQDIPVVDSHTSPAIPPVAEQTKPEIVEAGTQYSWEEIPNVPEAPVALAAPVIKQPVLPTVTVSTKENSVQTSADSLKVPGRGKDIVTQTEEETKRTEVQVKGKQPKGSKSQQPTPAAVDNVRPVEKPKEKPVPAPAERKPWQKAPVKPRPNEKPAARPAPQPTEEVPMKPRIGPKEGGGGGGDLAKKQPDRKPSAPPVPSMPTSRDQPAIIRSSIERKDAVTIGSHEKSVRSSLGDLPLPDLSVPSSAIPLQKNSISVAPAAKVSPAASIAAPPHALAPAPVPAPNPISFPTAQNFSSSIIPQVAPLPEEKQAADSSLLSPAPQNSSFLSSPEHETSDEIELHSSHSNSPDVSFADQLTSHIMDEIESEVKANDRDLPVRPIPPFLQKTQPIAPTMTSAIPAPSSSSPPRPDTREVAGQIITLFDKYEDSQSIQSGSQFDGVYRRYESSSTTSSNLSHLSTPQSHLSANNNNNNHHNGGHPLLQQYTPSNYRTNPLLSSPLSSAPSTSSPAHLHQSQQSQSPLHQLNASALENSSATIDEIQREIIEMRQRLLLAVSYPTTAPVTNNLFPASPSAINRADPTTMTTGSRLSSPASSSPSSQLSPGQPGTRLLSKSSSSSSVSIELSGQQMSLTPSKTRTFQLSSLSQQRSYQMTSTALNIDDEDDGRDDEDEKDSSLLHGDNDGESLSTGSLHTNDMLSSDTLSLLHPNEPIPSETFSSSSQLEGEGREEQRSSQFVQQTSSKMFSSSFFSSQQQLSSVLPSPPRSANSSSSSVSSGEIERMIQNVQQTTGALSSSEKNKKQQQQQLPAHQEEEGEAEEEDESDLFLNYRSEPSSSSKKPSQQRNFMATLMNMSQTSNLSRLLLSSSESSEDDEHSLPPVTSLLANSNKNNNNSNNNNHNNQRTRTSPPRSDGKLSPMSFEEADDDQSDQVFEEAKQLYQQRLKEKYSKLQLSVNSKRQLGISDDEDEDEDDSDMDLDQLIANSKLMTDSSDSSLGSVGQRAAQQKPPASSQPQQQQEQRGGSANVSGDSQLRETHFPREELSEDSLSF